MKSSAPSAVVRQRRSTTQSLQTPSLMQQTKAAVAVRLEEIRLEFTLKNPNPRQDSAINLKVLERLRTDCRMEMVWREILKRDGGGGGVRDFIHIVRDNRFKINDPEHKNPISNEDDQRIAIAKNIVTIAAWLVLEPPKIFTKAEHSARVVEAESKRQNDQENAHHLAMLRLPIYRRAAVERRKGNWEHRVKIAVFSTLMEKMFGKKSLGLTAAVLSVVLEIEITKDSVRNIMDFSSD